MRINPAALRAIRERSGLTQSALAVASGVSQARISELENQRHEAIAVRPTTAQALADALAVTLLAIALPTDLLTPTAASDQPLTATD